MLQQLMLHYLHTLSLLPLSVLLQNVVDTKKLHGNIIKITDFGLAQEIEQTIHMSGAEAHPWMAPEAISSSEFSQKSDVWRSVLLMNYRLMNEQHKFAFYIHNVL